MKYFYLFFLIASQTCAWAHMSSPQDPLIDIYLKDMSKRITPSTIIFYTDRAGSNGITRYRYSRGQNSILASGNSLSAAFVRLFENPDSFNRMYEFCWRSTNSQTKINDNYNLLGQRGADQAAYFWSGYDCNESWIIKALLENGRPNFFTMTGLTTEEFASLENFLNSEQFDKEWMLTIYQTSHFSTVVVVSRYTFNNAFAAPFVPHKLAQQYWGVAGAFKDAVHDLICQITSGRFQPGAPPTPIRAQSHSTSREDRNQIAHYETLLREQPAEEPPAPRPVDSDED